MKKESECSRYGCTYYGVDIKQEPCLSCSGSSNFKPQPPQSILPATAQQSVDAACVFEEELKQVLGKCMQQGLSVSNAVGVLALVQMEVSQAFIEKINRIPIA
jgi:hypothetical protein